MKEIIQPFHLPTFREDLQQGISKCLQLLELCENKRSACLKLTQICRDEDFQCKDDRLLVLGWRMMLSKILPPMLEVVIETS